MEDNISLTSQLKNFFNEVHPVVSAESFHNKLIRTRPTIYHKLALKKIMSLSSFSILRIFSLQTIEKTENIHGVKGMHPGSFALIEMSFFLSFLFWLCALPAIDSKTSNITIFQVFIRLCSGH